MNILLPHNNWTPRAYQLPLWEAMRSKRSQIREFYAVWPRRHGKDEMALHDAAIRTQERVGNYWHTLPQQEQARKAIWNGVNPHTGKRRWQDAFPSQLIRKVHEKEMLLELTNGSTWQLVGSDNYDSLVSSSAVHITFSEAALCDPNAISILRPILLENDGTSLYISTVRGRNHFYHMVQNANPRRAFVSHLSATDTDVFTPEQLLQEKDSLIAINGTLMGTTLFNQEYLSDWDSAEAGSVFGAEIATLLKENRHSSTIAYDPQYPVHTFWDLGVRDETVIIFAQFINNAVHIIDYVADTNIGLVHYARALRQKPYFYGYHFAPHDINQREFTTALSRKEEARRLQLDIIAVPLTNKTTQIAAASAILNRTYFAAPQTTPLLEQLQLYRFQYNKRTRTLSKTPRHDQASHYADAFQTLAVVAQADAHQPLDRQRLRQRPLDSPTQQPLYSLHSPPSQTTSLRPLW